MEATASASEIQLYPESFRHQEVPVAIMKSVTKIFGNHNTSNSVSAGFVKNSLGAELSIKLHIKHKQPHLKNLMFQINQNTTNSLLFRLNVYK